MSVWLRKWKRKDGKVLEQWVIDFVFKRNGQPPRRVRSVSQVNTRRGAEAEEREMLRALQDGTYDRKEVPTLEAFQDDFLAHAMTNNKPATVYEKRMVLKNHLLPTFGKRRLDSIGAADIERFKASKLAEGLERKSVNNLLTVLRKLLNLAEEYGQLPRAPRVKKLRTTPSPFQFLDFEETDRFLAAAAPEWVPWLVTALKTGLRVGELLALKWEDIDLTAGRLMVQRTLWRKQEGPPKGGRSREIPLSDLAISTLRAHRHLRGPYVFCGADGARLNHNRVKSVVPRTCARAGLAKRLTTHDLRHTFASHLVMRGVSLKSVQELLGHASIEMTMRYAHLSPDVNREAVQRLDGPKPQSHGAYVAHGPEGAGG